MDFIGNVFVGIGITATITFFCFLFVLGALKLNDFFKDIHTIAENTKK